MDLKTIKYYMLQKAKTIKTSVTKIKKKGISIMCGISGFINPEFDWLKNINRMNDKMSHRGPDASGIWCSEDKKIVLGHRRLSIIDLTSGGKQPMESHNERYAMVYNGEIYNYREIKEKLMKE